MTVEYSEVARIRDRVSHAAWTTIAGMTRQSLNAKEISDLRDDYVRRWFDEWMPNDDLSFYGNIDYLWCVYNCFSKFSSKYCVSFAKYVIEREAEVGPVYDMYAGGGMTSCLISLALKTKVYCQAEGHQAEVASQLAKTMGADVEVVNKSHQEHTLVTFECMEHFHNPYVELLPFVPTHRIVSTYSFGVPSIGHWMKYDIDELQDETRSSVVTRRINKHLTDDFGFRVVERFPMNRPLIMEK